MAFVDALTNTATFYTVSSGKDALGNDVKSEVALYTDIRARLHKRSTSGYQNPYSHEDFVETHVLQVEPQYDGADRGDKVVVKGRVYVIVQVGKPKGLTTTPHHINYYLSEQYDATI